MNYPLVIIVCDLETGGLKSSENPITEVAMCAFDEKLDDVGEYTSVVAPYNDKLIYTEGALKANGMSMELIRSGKTSDMVIEEMCEFLVKQKRGRNLPVLCGHNFKGFDLPFLQEFFNYHKKDLSKYVNLDFVIDTMYWSRLKWIESANYKLHTCCSNLGVELVDAHRALADTRANKELMKKFVVSLRGDGQGSDYKEKRHRETFQF
jgi:DNA polymerase III alpha subunit (gram-positive type)